MPTPFISSDNTYVIYYTNTLKGTISIPKNTIITSILDVALVGKSKLDYGSEFDENVLHLLENFASFQNPSPTIANTIQPDLSQVISPLLQQPVEGQFWYNKGYFVNNVQKGSPGLYVFTILPSNATTWKPITVRSDIAGNSGIIAHGQQIPLPAGIASYSQCSIFVSPQYLDVETNYSVCYSDANGNVFMRYRPDESPTGELVDGLANYIIIGNATATAPTYKPVVSVTPTLTPAPPPISPSPTPSVTPTAMSSPTPTTSLSATPSPSITPTPTVTRTITPTPTVTPSTSRIVGPTFTLGAVQHNYSPGLNYISYGAFRSVASGVQTVPNGDFESGNDGNWILSAGDVAIQTQNPYQGSFCLKFSLDHDNQNATMFSYGSIFPGQSVTAQAYLDPNNSGADTTMWVDLLWYTSTNVLISTTEGPGQQGGGYRAGTVTGIAPSNATKVKVRIRSATGTSPNPSFADLVTWNLGSSVITFGTLNSAGPPLVISLNGRLYYVDGIESYSDTYMAPQLGFYLRSVDGLAISSSPYPFTKVQFTDQFGILRTFSPTDANVITKASPSELAQGQMYTAWSCPSVLFTTGNYIITVFQ